MRRLSMDWRSGAARSLCVSACVRTCGDLHLEVDLHGSAEGGRRAGQGGKVERLEPQPT